MREGRDPPRACPQTFLIFSGFLAFLAFLSAFSSLEIWGLFFTFATLSAFLPFFRFAGLISGMGSSGTTAGEGLPFPPASGASPDCS